jgi:hypothetical protein
MMKCEEELRLPFTVKTSLKINISLYTVWNGIPKKNKRVSCPCFNRKKIIRHSLVGKFMQERCYHIHGAIRNKECCSWPRRVRFLLHAISLSVRMTIERNNALKFGICLLMLLQNSLDCNSVTYPTPDFHKPWFRTAGKIGAPSAGRLLCSWGRFWNIDFNGPNGSWLEGTQ